MSLDVLTAEDRGSKPEDLVERILRKIGKTNKRSESCYRNDRELMEP